MLGSVQGLARPWMEGMRVLHTRGRRVRWLGVVVCCRGWPGLRERGGKEVEVWGGQRWRETCGGTVGVCGKGLGSLERKLEEEI